MRHLFGFLAPVAIGLFTATAAPQAWAQAYPSKPISFIIPFGAGGSADALGRLVAQSIAQALKQPVVVENMPGASANIGMAHVAKAPPDGYTILFANNNLVTNQYLLKNVPFEVKSFEPVALLALVPNVLTVHPSVPAKDVKELIAYARANPGKLNYGSSGPGTSIHLASELFKSVTKTDIVHVPYKTSAQGMTDHLAGRLEVQLETAPTVIPQVKANQLRALAVASVDRLSELPDVPTFRELGFPEMVTGAWVGLLVPAGTPKDVVEKLNTTVSEQAKTPEYKDRMKQLGAQVLGGSPADFARFIGEQSERWGGIIKSVGITAQ
jgi:tripartite-type tricarboxylate transporter receptor subunit TctC